MNIASDTIDPRMVQGIVREVLERLRKQPGEPASSVASPAAAELFKHRLITVETLQLVRPGQTRILVSAKAIVTPAAADEAKQRNLTIERAGPSMPASRSTPNSVTLYLADADREPRAASIGRQLVSRGLQVETCELSAAIDGLVCGDVRVAVVLADLPAAVVCQACRETKIRAAAVRTHQELYRIEHALHPNLWVFDMHQMSHPQAAALLQRCVRLAATGAL